MIVAKLFVYLKSKPTQVYTDEERSLIERKFSLLTGVLQPYLKANEVPAVEKAYHKAREIYGERRMPAGELIILHVLDVARVAVEDLGLSMQSVIACFLHDAYIQQLISEDDIRKNYGQAIATMVTGFARLSDLPTDKVTLQSENFRKLFIVLIDDIRVILIKIAHRLYDMRRIDKLPEEKRKKYYNEVVHVYIPIAHRLGLYRVKKEMEDLAMKYDEPSVYQEIAQKIRDTEGKRNAFIQEFIAPIQKELVKNGFSFEIKGRPKSIPSIWAKMKKQNVEFEQVFDLFAIRIIIDTPENNAKSDCWRVYSLVTNIYNPNPKRLRDWISTPKASGYESLHTTVMGPNKKWVEVQIRTREMDELAEKGQAAHWRYKGFGSKDDTQQWLSQVRDILEHPDQIDPDYFEVPAAQKKKDTIYVFTPDGDLRELPAKATVLDFAFDIHTNVGYSCTGAKVNNKIVNLRRELQNGDKVEILTSKTQKPNLDWLNWVNTTRAKSKIKRALKESKFEEADKGNEILRRKFRNWKIPFIDSNIDKLIKRYKLNSSIDLYVKIYNEELDLLEIKRFLSGGEKEEQASTQLQKVTKAGKPAAKQGDVLQISKDLSKVNYKLAKCCNPIPGDEVFGFVTISKGITIHRTNCPNAKQLLARYNYRLIKVEWKENEDVNAFTSTIKVIGIDKVGMMNEISAVISGDLKVNMTSVNIDSRDGIFYGTLRLVVRNTKHLNELLHKLAKIPGVTKAVRIA